MENLKVNNNPFRCDGVIARLPFFGIRLVNTITLGATYELLQTVGESNPDMGGLIILGIIVSALLSIWISSNNIAKRVKDLMGNDYKSKHFIWTLIGSCIPIVNIVVSIYLIFMKGKVTSPSGDQK